MNRRSFLKTAAVSSTCSVFVNATGLCATAPDAARQASNAPEPAPPRLSGKDAFAARCAAEPHMPLRDLECDLFIAGGGMAGVCGALAAARNGARVILVQDRSRLGGNSSSEVKMHIVGADIHGSRPGWREGGIIEELRIEDAVRNPQRSREMWDLLLYEKLKAEPNIQLFLDTSCAAAEVESGAIKRVLARSDKTETLLRVTANLFADCTGDCRLALEAGADMRVGRESKAEFGESLALNAPDQQTLGSTILFTSRNFGKPMPFTPPSFARKLTADMLRFRPITSWEYGFWWVEWGGQLDTIKDNEQIRHELLAIALGVWDYIKNSGAHPSSTHWALDWLGMVPGKRGSRRILGDHVLTENDLMGKTAAFTDAVCIGGWSMDDHPPSGFDKPDLKPARQIPPPFPYNIPLRSLYSRSVSNLLMAGRNISATHVAFTSTRVMATCAVIGQAMGTAAAVCLKKNCAPRQLANSPEKVAGLHQLLLRDDQTIRSVGVADPLELARKAEVTASSAVEQSNPANVLNGEVRDLPGKWENRWGALMDGGSAHLDLEWPEPQNISHIQITFDTGFHRELTLTHQDSANARMVRGPQPETVRDYELLCRETARGEWRSLVKITGNYQRLRRHTLPAFRAKALRLMVTATNGSKEARVYEIRCYAEARS